MQSRREINEQKNNSSTVNIGKLKEYHFLVEKYQRGYKWTVREGLNLLNDIASYNGEDAF